MPVTIESYITYYPPPCNRHSSSYRHPRLPRVLHQWLHLCAAPLTRSPPRARRAHPQRTKYTGVHLHRPQHLSNHHRGALWKRNRPALRDREDLQHVPLRLKRRAAGQAPQTAPLHLAASVDGGCIHGVRDARVARGHPDLLRQRSRERAHDRTARRRRPLRPARLYVHAVATARGWLCRAYAVGKPRARPNVPARGV